MYLYLKKKQQVIKIANSKPGGQANTNPTIPVVVPPSTIYESSKESVVNEPLAKVSEVIRGIKEWRRPVQSCLRVSVCVFCHRSSLFLMLIEKNQLCFVDD